MKNFDNKVVWITGASSGIGREMAIQLSKRGAHIILSARSEKGLEQTLKQLNPGNHLILPLDMEVIDSFPKKVNQVFEKYNQLDLMFHNAGISQRSYIADTTLEVDKRLMDVNYFGTVALTKELLPHLRKQTQSYIAVNSSLGAKFGFYERSAYAASKFALHGFFETLMLEEFENNIGVSMLCAVGIKTEISQNALDGSGSKYGKESALQEDGIDVDTCVAQMIKGIENKMPEVIIGKGMQNHSVKIKALFPKLFLKMLRKNKP